MGPAVRIAIVFVAIFSVLGMHMPYFPAWLESRDLGPEEIGVVLGVIPWMRVVFNPLAGKAADAVGNRLVALVLAFVAVSSYAMLSITESLTGLIGVAILIGAAFSPLIPLTDAIALRFEANGTLDYGKVRRWGSIAFIASTLVGGWILDHFAEDAVLWTLVGCGGMVWIALLFCPAPPESASEETTTADAPRDAPTFVLFLLVTTVLHGSHASLYAFGTTHWRGAGIDPSVIGWLWAVGVLAEVVLFSYGKAAAKRLSAPGLLAAAGLGGLIRWPLLTLTAAPAILFAGQLLHALTFAALHLGAMQFIRNRVRPQAASSATALYSASSGVALGIGYPAAGWLYDAYGGGAFAVMAIASGLGIVGAAALHRRTRRAASAVSSES